MYMKFSDEAPSVVRDGDLIKVTIYAKDDTGSIVPVGRCAFTRHAAESLRKGLEFALEAEAEECKVLPFCKGGN